MRQFLFLILTLLCSFSLFSQEKQGTIKIRQNTELQVKVWDAITIDNMPRFPGGEAAMFQFIGNNIRYPNSSKNNLEQGVMYVSFIIDEQGWVNNVQVLNNFSDSISAEAIRVVSSMPRWNPGTVNNDSVSVQMTLPVRFTLR